MRRALAAIAFTSVLIGCELIVSDTVPDFQCTPGDDTSCPANLVCDPSSLTCVTSLVEAGTSTSSGGDDGGPDVTKPEGGPTSNGLGAPCDTSTLCADGLLCGTPTLLTTAIAPKATDAICTKPCCSSGDCDDGFVCFGAGTGGNYCVTAAKAQRGDLGAKMPGESCSDNNQCRSGVCEETRCLDLCCSADTCAAGTLCRVKSISVPPPARELWVCAVKETGASLKDGSGCSGTTQTCNNDNCVGFPAACRPTCCKNSDCNVAGTNLAFCAYGRFSTTQVQTKWCFDSRGGAGAAVGQSCTGDGDCANMFCDPDLRTCGTICCQDSDCGNGQVCQPTISGTTPPFLRCVKKQ
jgi:hypothetical protein